MSQSPLPFKLGWLLPPSFLFCPHPPATANAEALPGKRVASLCRAIPVKSLVPTDSETDALEFVGEEELLRRMAHREGRDFFLKNRRKMSQIPPSL
ncbi:hypothetical protein HMPREF0262_03087 [Clostridium sp. ATCC 29733]|nr:hypothetical protein HMPREF0262_03087 [Clostridium sp. ATCC 29733]